jgi:hypothetical protein
MYDKNGLFWPFFTAQQRKKNDEEIKGGKNAEPKATHR